MPKARLRAGPRDTRLVGVQLPWMQIEDGGLLLAVVHAADQRPRERIREQTEITAAAGRNIFASNSCSGYRNFQQTSPGGIGKARRVRCAVVIVAHRVDA